VLIDVVLESGGTYWRKRLDLPAAPAAGSALDLLDGPPLTATVVGATEPEGEDGAVSAAVLVRAGSGGPVGRDDDLRRAGWRCLLRGS
jgi:hypothetical protein